VISHRGCSGELGFCGLGTRAILFLFLLEWRGGCVDGEMGCLEVGAEDGKERNLTVKSLLWIFSTSSECCGWRVDRAVD